MGALVLGFGLPVGVLLGEAPAGQEGERRKLVLERLEQDDEIRVGLAGAATCKDVPALLDTLEGLPEGRSVRLVGEGLRSAGGLDEAPQHRAEADQEDGEAAREAEQLTRRILRR